MAVTKDKIDAYNVLVEKIKNYDKAKLQEMQLVPCKESNEVNFWAYWQGGREHLDADVLLVGQDWGTIDYKAEPIAEAVTHNPDELEGFCYMDKNNNLTNQHICELLKVMYPGVDFMSDCNTQKQLFFTNFVPWYREQGAKISGGYDKRWGEASSELFKDLVAIIQPKVILCLGQKTYNGVCDALNIQETKRGKSFSAIIEQGCHEAILDDCKIQVFPLMHPGYWGTRTRALDLQKKDWEIIKSKLDEMI